ncbi:hypothetical protein MOQ67_23435 [Pseudomonas sp. LY-1]
MDDQRKLQLPLLKKIAAGAMTISRPEDVILMNEFLRQGHVAALEGESFGSVISWTFRSCHQARLTFVVF